MAFLIRDPYTPYTHEHPTTSWFTLTFYSSDWRNSLWLQHLGELLLLLSCCLVGGCGGTTRPAAEPNRVHLAADQELVATDDGDREDIEKGLALFKAEKFEESAAIFRDCVESNPCNKDAHLWRARALLELGRLDEALSNVNEALDIDASCGEARFDRARLYTMKGDFDKAHKDLSANIEQRWGGFPDHMARAVVNLHRNEVRAAIADAQTAARVQTPSVGPTHVFLARIFASYASEEVRDGEEALFHAELALEYLGEKNPDVLATLAMACAELGMYQEAIAWQQQALSVADETLLTAFRGQLALYRAKRPYRAEGKTLAQSFHF